jgi:hypothetical protein
MLGSCQDKELLPLRNEQRSYSNFDPRQCVVKPNWIIAALVAGIVISQFHLAHARKIEVMPSQIVNDETAAAVAARLRQYPIMPISLWF